MSDETQQQKEGPISCSSSNFVIPFARSYGGSKRDYDRQCRKSNPEPIFANFR